MVPRFFAPDARDGIRRVMLPPDEAHHLVHVLRLAVGASVRVFNGAGGEWLASVTRASRSGVEIETAESIRPVAEPEVRVTLGVGILKGDQMDVVVRDATALGVAAIAPLISAHVTVPSRAWKSGAAVERWQRVAIASAKQCGRAVVPAIAPVARLEEVIAAAQDLIVMCVEPARAAQQTSTALPKPASALALIGPEGGWAPEEIDVGERRGARLIQLGPRTIRSEIAPTVLLSSLWTKWGW